MRSFSAGRATLLILGTAFACAIVACLLPTNPYQRRTQLDNTIYGSLTWIYERTHFDPAPVDVAFIGASRTLVAINAPRLEADLAARGVNAKVVNFAVLEPGRNLHALIVDDLLAAKKPRLLVVEIGERNYPYGHRAYKFVADNAAILKPRAFGLREWVYQLGALPYRNLLLAAAWMFPDAIGIRDRFDPARYPGSTPDTTTALALLKGRAVNMDSSAPQATLVAGVRDFERPKKPKFLPRGVAAHVYADELGYTRAIIDAARAHNIPIVFLFLPYYSERLSREDRSFYGQYGPIIDGDFVAHQNTLFFDWTHLNRRGASLMTDWVAAQIAPRLQAQP